MSKKKRIILITILSILVVVLMTAFVFATINFASSKKAHAEYSQLTNDTVVNFNQLISKPVVTINSNVTSAYFTSIESINYTANHKVYVYTNNTQHLLLALGSSGTVYEYIENDKIFTYTGNLTFNSIIFKSGLNSGTYYFKWIDLTDMFGQSNEPDIETCRNLFKAQYYYYNKGTPMFFGLNQNDMLQHIEYSFNTGLVYGYSQNITNTQVAYNEESQLVLSGVYSDNYSGYFLINLKTVIPTGSIITINLNAYTKQSGSNVSFVYADNYEEYITSIPNSANFNSPYSYSFVNTHETSAFYLICDNYSTGTIMTIQDANISVQFSDDYQFNLQSQYDLGYSDAETYYTNGYGRQIIWGEGYDTGYTRGISEGSLSDGWTFLSTMFSGVGSIFSIEIFPNITVGTFVMIPLLLGLIFFIVKLSRGGS